MLKQMFVQIPAGRWGAAAVFAMVLVCPVGCDLQPTQIVVQKRPLPVAVMSLTKSPAPSASLTAASAGSWKTEDIGFEVSGRIEFVVEQNASIEARVDSGGSQAAGTPIARIEAERFRLQVARADADVRRARQSLIAAETELTESIPAQIASAIAARTLAETDFQRSESLLKQSAVAQADFDRERASRDSAVARVKELEALQKAREAEIESLKNSVLQAQQNLRDAERNLEDCTLYSSFRGQVASVMVVPGSVVSAGQPVVRLQMMDPIKIEMEVSAQQSKRLRRTDIYPVHIVAPDGEVRIQQATIYQIDEIADPLTRTYTVTLLTLNKKLSAFEDSGIATTSAVWRLDLPFLPGAADGRLFVDEKAILHDAEGAYLWQITNATIGRSSPADDMYQVQKLRVTLGPFKAPYVDSLVFQEVIVADAAFDTHLNLVIGQLFVPEGNPSDWNGDRVRRDPGDRWLVRPGDIVKVDLSAGEKSEGYFIPLDAVARSQDRSFIFVIDESSGKSVARRILVNVVTPDAMQPPSSYCQIEPVEDVSLDGVLCITSGAHYIADGEEVRVISAGGDVE